MHSTMSIENACAATSSSSQLPSTDEAPEYVEREDSNELSFDDILNICREENAEIPAQENVAPNSQTIPESLAQNVAYNSQKTVPNRRRTEEIRRKRRERVGVQLQEARENFSKIAEKHAEALKIFAEASMKQSQNDSRRVILEEKRLQLEEKKLK
ncbi:PREDICTED: uncharacterized protein LOC105568186 isoform X2 [Vollenhovia emeryi]|uniref:uncharacterized protein LOC105568186 isoform X2 n=1 Tax=Vollenhovia emeryi TaxID=411798 RepID=UPI0005F4C062|nr:PREDICTED: uncharacterized protein LOC105568186 isoform X2 [Vollenhovia emeryi]